MYVIKKKDFKRGQKKNLVKEDASSLNCSILRGVKNFWLNSKKISLYKI
jgi:hypothetical protein